MNTELMPWVNEIESYINDDNKKVGEVKKFLKNTDLSYYTMLDLEKLVTLFDPNCKISCKVLRRELDLYFALLNDKPEERIRLPYFSEYVDSLYEQDIGHLRDEVFDIMVSGLLKSKASDFPKPLNGFMSRLPEQFSKNLDTISNERLIILIKTLQKIDLPYDKMPNECQGFVRNLFAACAVKTEISDNNRSSFHGIFKDNPQRYYSMFNKAFAGVGKFDEWVDEPAKKITLDNMIRYANYQKRYLDCKPHSLSFDDFRYFASGTGFDSCDYNYGFLKESREYKSYATRAKDLFADMLNSELCNFARSMQEGNPDYSALKDLVLTDRMKDQMNSFIKKDPHSALSLISYYLVDLVHLDELIGKNKNEIISRDNIFNALHKEQDGVQLSLEQSKILSEKEDDMKSRDNIVDDLHKEQDDMQLSLEQSKILSEKEEEEDMKSKEQSKGYYVLPENLSIEFKIKNRLCTPSDLPDLYSLVENGNKSWEILNIIHDLEVIEKEEREDEESFGK